MDETFGATWLPFLQDISAAINRPGNTHTLCQTTLTKLTIRLNLTESILILLNKNQTATFIKAKPQTPIVTQPIAKDSFIHQLLQTQEPHRYHNQNVSLLATLFTPAITSTLFTPLLVGDEVFGYVGCGLTNTTPALTSSETELIQITAHLLAARLKQTRATETSAALQTKLKQQVAEFQQQEQYLAILHDIEQIQIDADVESALSKIAQRLGHLIDADGCYITRWDEERAVAIPVAAYGRVPSGYAQVELRPGERTLTQSVLEVAHPLIIDNLRNSPHLANRVGRLFPSISALVLPLLINKNKLGAFIIAFNHTYNFSQEQITLYERIAKRIAQTLSKINLFDTTRRQLEELKILQAIALACTEEMTIDSLLNRVTTIIGHTFYPSNFGVLLLDPTGTFVYPHASYHLSQNEVKPVHVPLGSGIVGLVAQTGQPLRLDDVTKDPRYINLDPTAKSELCVAMKIDSRIIGVVNAESSQEKAFTHNDQRLLTTLANQIATALEKIRLFDETRQRASELALLNKLSQDFTALLTVRDLSQLAVANIQQQFGYYNVGLATLSPDGEALIVQGLAGAYANDILPIGFQVPKNRGLIGNVMTTGVTTVVNDTQGHPDFYEFEGPPILSECVIPLKRQGATIGVLNIDSNKLNTFTEDNTTLLTTIADQLSLALEKAHLFEETHTRATELTTLMNVSTTLRLAKTKEAMLDGVLVQCITAVKADLGTLLLQDVERGDLVIEACQPPSLGMVGSRYTLGRGVSGHVFTTGEHYISGNVHDDAKVYLEPGDRKRLAQARTLISLPLRTHEDVVGVMHIVFQTTRHHLSDREVNLLLTIAEIAGSALQRTLVWEMLEQRVAERTRDLAKANERLQELDKLKSKFVSDVSHELRTPITNLGLYLDLLERGKPAKQAYYWQVLRQQSGRLTQLIEDILRLSRLEAYQGNFELQPVDLNALIQGVVRTHQVMAKERGLQLVFDPAGIPLLPAEPDYLTQVITNLIVNGLNYTPAGIIYLSTHTDNQHIILRIKDTGLGISPDDLPNLFQRFYRGQNATEVNTPGTGLGLAIVKEIITLHGGTIEVSSVLGEGSEFVIKFPLNT